jgi:general secretion pathway protein C
MPSMASSFKSVWLPRLVAFTFAGLAGSSAGYWVLKGWGSQANGAPSIDHAELDSGVSITSVTRALDGTAAPANTGLAGAPVPIQVSGRFTLMGVVAGRSSNGAALISVDGARPKPYVVGAKVTDEWLLRSVQNRTAVLRRSDAVTADTSTINELAIHLPSLTTGPTLPR